MLLSSKSITRTFVLVAALLLFVLIFTASSNAENEITNAEDILKNFELLEKGQIVAHNSKNYESVKDFAQALEGRTITGSGSVVSVISSPQKIKVTILSKGSNPKKGYNIVLITNQNAKSDLFKNDHILFKGTIGNISAWHNVSIDVEGTYEKKE